MPTRITDLAESIIISTGSFVPIVDANESINSKNKKISVNDLRKYFYLNGNNSSSFTRHTPGLYYFGDNSDGSGNFSGSITTLRTRISASFASTSDGPPVIKNFSSLFISRSVVISPTNRCRGMLIFVDGDATISGSITMTSRGASAVGADASFTTINPPYLGDYWSTQLFPSSSYLSRVFAVGAAGGGGSTAGTAGGLGRSGGGGGGSTSTGPYGTAGGGSGGTGTSYSGGAGGGGGGAPGGAGSNGSPIGGAGGNGGGGGNSGGGAGNPNGTGGSQTATGTGGLLILIVRGNLKIGPNGSITTNGSAGNNANISGGSGAGGGSGGGVLSVYYGGQLTNNGSVTSNGGSGGSPFGGGASGAGGAGTAIIAKLNTAFPVAN